MRVLIGMLSHRTGSVALAQLMHASLTGFLALLSPPADSPAQEAGWYVAYGAALWLLLAAVAALRLGREHLPSPRLRPLFSQGLHGLSDAALACFSCHGLVD
jgi:hypothetical protein